MGKRNLLTVVGNKMSCAAGMTGLKIRENKPKLLLIVGLVSMTGAVVSAVRAARKHDSIIDDHLKRLEIAKAPVVVVEAMEPNNPDSYLDQNESKDVDAGNDVVRERSEKEIKHAVFKCYLVTGVKFVGNWSITLGCMALSTLALTKMYSDQSSAIVGLTSAYMGCKEYIDLYEKRNIELNGIENHNMCKYGYEEIEVEEEDPDNGEKYTIKKKVPISNEKIAEMICDDEGSNFFDQCIFVMDKHTSFYYSGIANIDMTTLNSAEQHLNDLLATRGWVVINDGLRELGMDLTDSGRDNGWVKGCGEKISLGFNTSMRGMNERFINGFNDEPIIIEFNVHGNVNYLRKKQIEAKKKEVKS